MVKQPKYVKDLLAELEAKDDTFVAIHEVSGGGRPHASVKDNADRYNASVFALLAYGVEPMWCYPTSGPASGTVQTVVAHEGQVVDMVRRSVDAINRCLGCNLDVLEGLERDGVGPIHTDEALHTLAAALQNRLHSYAMGTWHTGVHDPPRLVPLFNQERRRLERVSVGTDPDSRRSDGIDHVC